MDTQQIRAILLHEFKIGCIAAETTNNIKVAFGQGTVNERYSSTSIQNIS
jgi:hypothetical protein